MKMYRIGIDLGGTNIAAGLVNEKGEIVKKLSVPTNADRAAEEIAADIVKLCHGVCNESGVSADEVLSVGIATPGIADDESGEVVYANNLPFRHFPIRKLVSEGFYNKPVHIANDANAAALGEAAFGAANGTSNSVMITLGTGVGGGIIIDKKIFCGSNGAGGELGHIVIEYNGQPCSCGRKGCWEAYSSATALIRMTKEKIEECHAAGRPTIMDELVAKKGKVSGITAFAAMREGDEAAKEVVDTYLRYLAIGLGNIVNIFQPEVISLGGGISNEGQSLVEAIVPLVQKEQYGGGIVHVAEIKIAKLGNDAGIIGAAML
jgi:glucokinase